MRDENVRDVAWTRGFRGVSLLAVICLGVSGGSVAAQVSIGADGRRDGEGRPSVDQLDRRFGAEIRKLATPDRARTQEMRRQLLEDDRSPTVVERNVGGAPVSPPPPGRPTISWLGSICLACTFPADRREPILVEVSPVDPAATGDEVLKFRSIPKMTVAEGQVGLFNGLSSTVDLVLAWDDSRVELTAGQVVVVAAPASGEAIAKYTIKGREAALKLTVGDVNRLKLSDDLTGIAVAGR